MNQEHTPEISPQEYQPEVGLAQQTPELGTQTVRDEMITQHGILATEVLEQQAQQETEEHDDELPNTPPTHH